MMFELQESSGEHGTTVLAVVGELDVGTAPRLREVLVRLAADTGRPPRVVLDLSGVDFLDSTGLGVLLGGAKRLRAQGGGLALARAEPQVRKVLEVTRVIEILPLHEELAGAAAELART